MVSPDLRGMPCSSDSAAARDAAEQALRRMMSFHGTPLADLDAAIAADPQWCLPHVMKAGFLLGLAERSLGPRADEHLAQAHALALHATLRERAHLDAVQLLAQGLWHGACRSWGELLLQQPRDALALHWAQLWDFYRGDAISLRQRPARALPDWDAADPLQPYVLGLYAFGLEENNLHALAEDVGRQALAANAQVPWAVHAVAHVMEVQGRYEEGSAWLRQHQPAATENSGFASHLWWLKALFRLEALDIAGVLRLIDNHLSGEAPRYTLQRVGAASILWRLHLLGEDVSAAGAALLERWPADDGEAGHHAFNDVHRVLALLAAAEQGRAEAWVARCAEKAMDVDDARRSNHATAREVALPLMRGLLALGRGDADGAVDSLYPLRASVPRLGGSQAQRDVIDLSVLAAAARGGRRQIGRALLNERLMAKPLTPLTRWWVDRLADDEEERA
ncbi:MAG: tetratricopeptide repeat protein [Rubrivivax sp.]|nr:tetratricopeptide repeat protein [Rubrivivax sp.]